MIGWAGVFAQELINHRTIMDTIDFYKIYPGLNPYENCGGDGNICYEITDLYDTVDSFRIRFRCKADSLCALIKCSC